MSDDLNMSRVLPITVFLASWRKTNVTIAWTLAVTWSIVLAMMGRFSTGS
jgi:hypothetical protein